MHDSPYYPPIDPYHASQLTVSNIHRIYYEQCGNSKGIPVVFLHGGPGGGCEPLHRRFFNPSFYRIVLFDQRGAGRSVPTGDLRENTTWDLVADIEALRVTLGIEKWLVFGGSWGSTLALAYAEKHPDRVLGLILRGIFLCRPLEIRWFYQQGADQIFPDLWEPYAAHIPEQERHDMVGAYYRRLTSSSAVEQLAAARIWSTWEAGTSKLHIDASLIERFGEDQFALRFARIESHYFINNSFLDENQLLRDVHKIRHIPGVIVQGRYDIVCPMRSAWDLHRAWPEADLHVIPDAGHGATEAGIAKALREAADSFTLRLGA